MRFASLHISAARVALVFEVSGGEEVLHRALAVGTRHFRAGGISGDGRTALAALDRRPRRIHPSDLTFVALHSAWGHRVGGRHCGGAGLASHQQQTAIQAEKTLCRE